MITSLSRQRELLGIALGLCTIAMSSAAIAETQSYADVSGTVGYTRNPFLVQDSKGSAFGRLSAFGFHTIRSERSTTDLSGFVENSTYLREYGSKQIFALDASTRYKVSELVELFLNAELSGDIGGQLLGRFNNVPNQPPPPPEPGGAQPPPDGLFDPNVLNLDRRQYRVAGQAGTTLKVSERDSLSVAAAGQHVFFGKNGDELNYTVGTGTIEWQRQWSERTSAGARMSLQRANYPGSDHRSTVYSPQLIVHTLLGAGWDADFAAGVSFVRHRTETDHAKSISPALDAAICRTTESERYCGRASYSTETATSQDALKTATMGLDFFKRLNAKDTLQARVNLIHYSGNDLGSEASKTSYYVGGMSFSRKLSDRLSAGADAGARKVLQKDESKIPLDVSVSAFVRYRLGDLL